MKAILHIGTEKTGTTTIQEYLYNNRQQLRKAGYHVLQSAGKYNSRALPAACIADDKRDDYWRDLGIETPEERQAHRDVLVRNIAGELEKLPAKVHTVLISSEHFHSRIRTDDEMDNVHRLLSQFFDEFKIVCYLREQVTTCASWYSTSLKSGGTKSFSEFMERCNARSHYFNYYEMLASWERFFGIEALDVRLFSRSRFLNGDLLDDFTERVDPALVGSLNKAIEAKNESLTPVGQALARAINLTFPVDAQNPGAARARDMCKNFINVEHRGAGQFPPLETQQKLYESFAASNEKLREKFFPQVESLFQPPSEDTRLDDSLEDDFVASLYVILDLLKQELGGAVQAGDIVRFVGLAATCINDLYREGEESSDSAGGSVVLNNQVARLLRDSAFKLEWVDVAYALPLMELATKVNPSMKQAKKRLERYREQLQRKAKPRFIIAISMGHQPEDSQELKDLVKDVSVWYSQFTAPPQLPMLPNSNSMLVRSDGTVLDEGEDSASLYAIIEADSMEEAVEAAKDCPALRAGGSVRISRLTSLKQNS